MPPLLQPYADKLERFGWWLRLVFIGLMSLYLVIAIASLAVKLFAAVVTQGAPEFDILQVVLNDALLVLIVMAIVRTLFIYNSFEYALTFLEVGFVVILRKLILLETTPESAWVLLILGVVSALFFGLILYTHYLKHDIEGSTPAS
jgi:hypothetical protein